MRAAVSCVAVAVAFGAAFGVVPGTAEQAEARSAYLGDLNERYGTSGTRLDTCSLCHAGPKDLRNVYGLDMEAALAAGAKPRDALIAIEPLDSDADGYSNVDEINANAFPGDAADVPISKPCTDSDADGYYREGDSCGPVDCNDADPFVNPGATEQCINGVDDDCDGLVDTQDPDAVDCPPQCTDVDGDGYFVEGGVCGAVDCDDIAGDVHPGSVEECHNGIDDDCDELVDADDSDCGACIPTADHEGRATCRNDLDDDCDGLIDGEDPDCREGDPPPELCDDDLDNDGDGRTDCEDPDCADHPTC